jgi:hypothetical protein
MFHGPVKSWSVLESRTPGVTEECWLWGEQISFEVSRSESLAGQGLYVTYFRLRINIHYRNILALFIVISLYNTPVKLRKSHTAWKSTNSWLKLLKQFHPDRWKLTLTIYPYNRREKESHLYLTWFNQMSINDYLRNNVVGSWELSYWDCGWASHVAHTRHIRMRKTVLVW